MFFKTDYCLVFKTDYLLMQVKSIAECPKRSILLYFRPALSYHLSLRLLFFPIFEWPLKTGFTVGANYTLCVYVFEGKMLLVH